MFTTMTVRRKAKNNFNESEIRASCQNVTIIQTSECSKAVIFGKTHNKKKKRIIQSAAARVLI